MKFARLLALAFSGMSVGALAQAPVASAPLSAPVKLQYQSAFADYRPYVDPEVIVWKQANDDAAAIGGPKGQMARDAVPGTTARPGAVPAMPSKPATALMPSNPEKPSATSGAAGKPR